MAFRLVRVFVEASALLFAGIILIGMARDLVRDA